MRTKKNDIIGLNVLIKVLVIMKLITSIYMMFN